MFCYGCHIAVKMENDQIDELSVRILERSEQSLIPLLEDVAEWVGRFMKVELKPESFLDQLDNGVLICYLAGKIQKASVAFVNGRVGVGPSGVQTNLKALPKLEFQCHKAATKESFFARENCANFLNWCSKIGIQDSTLFESEGLVLHKQLKNVVLTLLELGRVCASYNMEPLPSLVRLEREIDQEELDEYRNVTIRKKRISKVSKDEFGKGDLDNKVQSLADTYKVEVKKVKDGKYIVAGKSTVFVRVLRNHIMVRVGGGWDELGHFLSRHDPDKVGKILTLDDYGEPVLDSNNNNLCVSSFYEDG